MTKFVTLSIDRLNQVIGALNSYCNTGEIDCADDLVAELLAERDQKQGYLDPLTDMQKMMCWSRATHDADVWHKTDHQCLMDYGSEIESAHGIK